MLFISPHPLYQILGIVNEQDVYHPTNGKYLRTEPAVNAEFFHSSPPQWATEQALANPRFQSAWNALPDGAMKQAYIGVFDTEAAQVANGWSDETREYVEEFLLSYPDYGLSYVKAELPEELLNKPWPNYDETHHMKIVKIAKETGTDLQVALDYERKHKARPRVIEELEAAIDVAPTPTAELIPA